MLDLPRMERISLSARPKGQLSVANTAMAFNFHVMPGIEMVVEGLENVPDEPVIFALNHTDRYNYWPFQYSLYRKLDRFTASWVKAKYYESAFVGWFMEQMNSIPTVQRGYLIVRDFIEAVGRKPNDAEYAALKTLFFDVEALVEKFDASHSIDPEPLTALAQRAVQGGVPKELFAKARNMLGRPFAPSTEGVSSEYALSLLAVHRRMMQRFIDLHGEAIGKRLDLLIFPQGTRSIRLSRGHIGISEVALHFRRKIVPVGCNGSDKVYPGGSPWAKKGRIVFRFGKPINETTYAQFDVPGKFEPFSTKAERDFRPQFQGLADVVMDRINELVDEPYKFSDEKVSDGVRGADRFV
jgi:1-acyl-sn-glycerol-3-phosphate acyltransferase